LLRLTARRPSPGGRRQPGGRRAGSGWPRRKKTGGLAWPPVQRRAFWPGKWRRRDDRGRFNSPRPSIKPKHIGTTDNQCPQDAYFGQVHAPLRHGWEAPPESSTLPIASPGHGGRDGTSPMTSPGICAPVAVENRPLRLLDGIDPSSPSAPGNGGFGAPVSGGVTFPKTVAGAARRWGRSPGVSRARARAPSQKRPFLGKYPVSGT